MLSQVIAFHIEDGLFDVKTRFHMDQQHNNDGNMSNVLRAEQLRRLHCCSLLEKYIVKLPPGQDRSALSILPSAVAMQHPDHNTLLILFENAWQQFTVTRPNIIIAWMHLLRPCELSLNVEEAERLYVELEHVLSNL